VNGSCRSAAASARALAKSVSASCRAFALISSASCCAASSIRRASSRTSSMRRSASRRALSRTCSAPLSASTRSWRTTGSCSLRRWRTRASMPLSESQPTISSRCLSTAARSYPRKDRGNVRRMDPRSVCAPRRPACSRLLASRGSRVASWGGVAVGSLGGTGIALKGVPPSTSKTMAETAELQARKLGHSVHLFRKSCPGSRVSCPGLETVTRARTRHLAAYGFPSVWNGGRWVEVKATPEASVWPSAPPRSAYCMRARHADTPDGSTRPIPD
jgi:hypothetical protein